MPVICNAFPSPGNFTPAILAYLDCQAQSIGMQGYQALAAPGSTVSLLLTSFITLLIAVFGYRMLLGHVPNIQDAVLTIVKIGVVLVLATGWPAYQILIYDVVLREPAELAASIGGATGLPGTTGDLVSRLDGIDEALQSLAIQGVGNISADAAQAPTAMIAPPPFLGFDAWALGWARIGFLVSAIGSLAIVRVTAGVMLALGPLFLLFLLFETTRGLVAGWVRALLFCLIGSTTVSLVIGVELGLLEPWLRTLLVRRDADLDIMGAPAQLLAISVIFAVTMFAALAVTAFVAAGLKLPVWSDRRRDETVPSRGETNRPDDLVRRAALHEERSRAAAVSDAVASSQRREANGATIAQGTNMPVNVGGRGPTNPGLPGYATAVSSRRRVGTRVSARARIRDRAQ